MTTFTAEQRIIAQQVADGLGPVTDEGMRNGFVAGFVAAAQVQGDLEPHLATIEKTAEIIFDQWLAKRDLDIYDQAYAHGFLEGSAQDD